MFHRHLEFILSVAEFPADPFLLLPVLSCLSHEWSVAHQKEWNKWGFPWLPCSPPTSDGYHVLLTLPPVYSPDTVLFSPAPPLHSAATSSCLGSLPRASVPATAMHFLSLPFRVTCLKQGADYPHTLIPLTAATCPLRWTPNTLARFNWNPQRLIPVWWPSSSPAAFAAHGTLHIFTGCLAGWFRMHHPKHLLTDKSFFLPYPGPCCLSCPPLPFSPRGRPSHMLADSTMYDLPWHSAATVVVCLACSPGLGAPSATPARLAAPDTRRHRQAHVSRMKSGSKALPTPLTALPSALWPLAARPASVLVGVSCAQIAGVCWLCPTEVGWIEPVSSSINWGCRSELPP